MSRIDRKYEKACFLAKLEKAGISEEDKHVFHLIVRAPFEKKYGITEQQFRCGFQKAIDKYNGVLRRIRRLPHMFGECFEIEYYGKFVFVYGSIPIVDLNKIEVVYSSALKIDYFFKDNDIFSQCSTIS